MENTQETSYRQTLETSSTLKPQEMRSAADLLSSLSSEEIEEFLDSLSYNALLSLPWLFEHWAHAHQKTPKGDWKTWVIMGGRGAGKTRAGAEWVRAQVEGSKPNDPGRCKRVALIAETLDQARDVMVFGESGVIACSPHDRRPVWQATKSMTSAPTQANSAYLADSFLEHVEERYAGSRLGRQELDGELLSDTEGALWSRDAIDAVRVSEAPELDRIVVAVDPPVTSNANSDDCGIMVVGVTMEGPPQDWRAYVLEDATMSAASPTAWAERAVNLYHKHGADRLVAEVNQGGDLVETLVRQVDPLASYSGVRATRGKVARAEPVAALYEQGRVCHVGGFGDLEDQMCQIARGGYAGSGSPDRVDALVWALTDLMIEPAAAYRAPHIRSL